MIAFTNIAICAECAKCYFSIFAIHFCRLLKFHTVLRNCILFFLLRGSNTNIFLLHFPSIRRKHYYNLWIRIEHWLTCIATVVVKHHKVSGICNHGHPPQLRSEIISHSLECGTSLFTTWLKTTVRNLFLFHTTVRLVLRGIHTHTYMHF